MKRTRANIQEQQECSACGSVKALGEFPSDQSRIGGVRGTCKRCRGDNRSRWNRTRIAYLRDQAKANLPSVQVCLKCELEKPIKDFVPHRTSRTGISKKCRECIQKDATKDNPVSRQPGYARFRSIGRLYGLSKDRFEEIRAAQHGVCAICNRPETRRTRTTTASDLCVDHDHSTGKVRGLLCVKCNAAIGHLNDDPVLARSLAAYLEAGPK